MVPKLDRVRVQYGDTVLKPDEKRVIIRPFFPGNESHLKHIVQKVLLMEETQVKILLQQVMGDFSRRHRALGRVLLSNYQDLTSRIPVEGELSEERKMLLGAYFSGEYSVEAAALFNPSIVMHPDQRGLAEGQLRFIMSFRAVGEGHISSIVFRGGVIDETGRLSFYPNSPLVARPDEVNFKHPQYHKRLFLQKLMEMDACDDCTTQLMQELPEQFNYQQMVQAIDHLEETCSFPVVLTEKVRENLDWLARSYYEMTFYKDRPLSERVIFPVTENERNGIEDARFVRFTDDDGRVMYYATYTAYNGVHILPQLIETEDFVTFKVSPIYGRAVQDKGVALFPRKVNGKYVMLSRQDGENMHIMYSDALDFWNHYALLDEPEYPWELNKIGNCGSPLETEAGWLVLTHGVGPMRQYCIGAMLLDKNDPSRVLGKLHEPLILPDEEHRDGYVPNVVYSCGGLIHRNWLIIPYGISDSRTGIAKVPIYELLSRLLDSLL